MFESQRRKIGNMGDSKDVVEELVEKEEVWFETYWEHFIK